MPLGMFVNPVPQLRASHLLQFDFPVKDWEYTAPDMFPNIDLNLAVPGIEELYGKLGTPPREQGHPCLREVYPAEQEDPNRFPYQDQVIDIDRNAMINHTGRLSGSFVRFLACEKYQSKVKIVAHALTNGAGTIQVAPPIVASLRPETPAPNKWFYKDAAKRDELLFCAYVNFDPNAIGLEAEHAYKLIIRWEFWDTELEERLPISGFTESVAFEVISATGNL